MTAFSLKKTFLIVTGLALLLSARTAFAQACTNDIDCTANPACGGEVCDWVTAPIMTCKAAGSQPKDHDGWCSADTDCKCHGQGATCDKSTFSCTFTRPCDAPGAAGCGAAGSGGGGSGGGGSGGGTTGTDGGNTGGGGGGGCTIAGTDVALGWPALALVIGLTLTRRGRRRR
jgi:hypothetical protein